jgi:hypothetical protein
MQVIKPTAKAVEEEEKEDEWKDDEDVDEGDEGGKVGRRGRSAVRRKVSGETKFPPRDVSVLSTVISSKLTSISILLLAFGCRPVDCVLSMDMRV